MTLQAVRFKTREEAHHFIQKYVSLRTIDKHSKIPNITKPFKNFIISTEGFVYFLNDIKNYLTCASEKELKDSNIRFKASDNEIISLSQLKNQSSLFDKIKPSLNTYLLLTKVNLNLFQSKSLPSLNSMKDINEALIQFNTKDFHDLTRRHLSEIELIKYSLNRTSLERFYSHFKYITSLHKDLLKLTILEEDKLKNHLSNELTKLSNQEEITAVNDWIATIVQNREETLKYFQELSDCLSDIQTFIADKKLRYQRIADNDPTLEKTKEKINRLSAEKIPLESKVQDKENNLIRSQVLAVGGILFAPVILLPIVALTLVITLAPAFLMIAAGITALYAIALIVTFSINDTYQKAISAIENLVSKPLDDLKEQLTDLNHTLEYAKEDVIFMQDYPEWHDNFIPQFGNPNHIMKELYSDIRELSQLRPAIVLENTPIHKPAPSSASAGKVGLFGSKEKNEASETESLNAAISP